MNMKVRYRLFLRRKSVYYAFDDTAKTFASLKTKDKAEANRLKKSHQSPRSGRWLIPGGIRPTR